MIYKTYLKRPIDLILSINAVIIFSPLFLLLYLVLYFQNKGGVFFIHKRPGLREKEINVIKFKTMTDERDKEGELLPDVQRMTPAGKVLRRFSLDELPQLFNVIKGDMSLVGPRPLLFKYLPLYNEEQRRRHEMRPGITGLAQVKGRNAIDWQTKFTYDVFYVDHISLGLDLKILWLTVKNVLKREGIDQSAARPMQPFKGNE